MVLCTLCAAAQLRLQLCIMHMLCWGQWLLHCTATARELMHVR
jgi:hypothetical protein